MDFKVFKDAVGEQFSMMASDKRLFITDVGKEELWETYLLNFPEGTNPVYKERREHDCQCCKQFIRACGNVVAIDKDLQLQSIWDIEIGGYYQVVADALSSLVKARAISQIFLHDQRNLGTDTNIQLIEEGTEDWEDKQTITWEHFYFKLPFKFVNKEGRGTVIGNAKSNKQVFERGLNEISLEAAKTVQELIGQNSIYRGEEMKPAVESFIWQKIEYDEIEGKLARDLYCWKNSKEGIPIRNTVIGTLLCDISDEVSLDAAVGKYESKVAPANYKRPTALISKAMIAKAQKKVTELGIEDSLQRRYAVPEDITINNVLFADRSVKPAMGVFDVLKKQTSDEIKNLDKIVSIDIGTFVQDILPRVDTVELLFNNNHVNNLMSLISPMELKAKPIFKWNNNFSWGYNGEVADSIKERVKKAGGNVNGILRCSLSWFNYDDLDIHVREPSGNHIYYGNSEVKHPSSGILDVDMNVRNNHSRKAVENIVWTDKERMQPGVYKVFINNFTPREMDDVGFIVEIEYNGVIHTFNYNQRVIKDVPVAKFTFSKEKGIEFITSLPTTHATKEVWGINTQKFQKVSMIMNSPNHWDGNQTGNKHYFFILEGCKNDKSARGFYNEFLNEDLREHRKVFEVLGSQMKVEHSDNQLSGLGFSSTQKNEIVCKLKGTFTRIIKINF